MEPMGFDEPHQLMDLFLTNTDTASAAQKLLAERVESYFIMLKINVENGNNAALSVAKTIYRSIYSALLKWDNDEEDLPKERSEAGKILLQAMDLWVVHPDGTNPHKHCAPAPKAFTWRISGGLLSAKNATVSAAPDFPPEYRDTDDTDDTDDTFPSLKEYVERVESAGGRAGGPVLAVSSSTGNPKDIPTGKAAASVAGSDTSVTKKNGGGKRRTKKRRTKRRRTKKRRTKRRRTKKRRTRRN